jgi:hypothetical protein
MGRLDEAMTTTCTPSHKKEPLRRQYGATPEDALMTIESQRKAQKFIKQSVSKEIYCTMNGQSVKHIGIESGKPNIALAKLDDAERAAKAWRDYQQRNYSKKR